MALYWVIIGLILTVGCQRGPKWQPMPAQRRPPGGLDPVEWRSYVKFVEPDADKFVVRDIGPSPGWNWTFDHPELRFFVQPRPGLRYVMSFWMVDTTMRATGPVTVVVKINGHLLESVRCTKPGNYHVNQLVPLDWLPVGEPVHVLAEASPLWTSNLDGKHLGYLLEEAGFQ